VRRRPVTSKPRQVPPRTRSELLAYAAAHGINLTSPESPPHAVASGDHQTRGHSYRALHVVVAWIASAADTAIRWDYRAGVLPRTLIPFQYQQTSD